MDNKKFQLIAGLFLFIGGILYYIDIFDDQCVSAKGSIVCKTSEPFMYYFSVLAASTALFLGIIFLFVRFVKVSK